MSAAPLDERGLPPGYPLRPELELTPREAAALMADPEAPLLLVDCRTREEVAAAAVPGAVHIPVDELPSRAEEIDAALGDDEDRPVAFLCHHGVRSLKAALWLRQRGIQARSVAGGIDLWSRAVDASIPRYDRGTGGRLIRLPP